MVRYKKLDFRMEGFDVVVLATDYGFVTCTLYCDDRDANNMTNENGYEYENLTFLQKLCQAEQLAHYLGEFRFGINPTIMNTQ